MASGRARSVHILDRLTPELEANIQLEDLGVYLISEGLITGEEHLSLCRCSSRSEGVIQLVQKIKRKGPCSLQLFLAALRRSCNETVPPHMGHVHLLEVFQSNINDSQLAKQNKSKSKLTLLGWTRRGKKTKKDAKDLPNSSTSATFPKHSYQLNRKDQSNRNSLNLTSEVDSMMFSQSQATTEMDLTLPHSQDSYQADTQSDSVRFTLPSTDPHSTLSKSSADLSSNPTSTATTESTTKDDNSNQLLLKEMKRRVKELEYEVKQKSREVEKYRATVKELMIKYDQVKSRCDLSDCKVMNLHEDNRILQYQLTEASEQAMEDDAAINDLEYEVKQLHTVIQRMRMERDSMQRYVDSSMGRRRPSIVHPMYQPAPSYDTNTDGCSPPSPLQPSECDTVEDRSVERRPNHVDQLKRQLSQKDIAVQHKLDQMVQMCHYNPSIMRRKWHSDYRLGSMY